jgi:predicted transcriptional regulator
VKRDLDPDSILLTRCELQIMKVVWDEGAVTVKEVCQALSRHKVIAYTTVLTFMKILERKGVLGHTRSGRAFLYRPVLSRQQATRNHVHDAIDRFFDGHPEKLLADVLNNEFTSPEQLGYAKSFIGLWQENEVA